MRWTGWRDSLLSVCSGNADSKDCIHFLQGLGDGDVLAPFAIELDLEAWAYKHIESSDRSLAEFLNTQGIY